MISDRLADIERRLGATPTEMAAADAGTAAPNADAAAGAPTANADAAAGAPTANAGAAAPAAANTLTPDDQDRSAS